MKKMNKTLAIAIAAAMVSPSAFAAQDTSGMQFTSASEGFYASLRARLDFSSNGTGGEDNYGSNKDGNASIANNSSRIGIRGTNDLGGGLSGFYQWEADVTIDDSDQDLGSIRLGHVGLRGSFGEIVVGSFWANDYSFTHGGTDIANNYSGWLTYNDQREGRTEKAIQYTTPDLNGFQGAVRVDVGSNDNTQAIATSTSLTNAQARALTRSMDFDGSDDAAGMPSGIAWEISAARSDSDIDGWNIAAKYDIQGFSVGASYNNLPDRLEVFELSNISASAADINITGYDDLTSWTIKSGYAQDNWYVNAWYGEDNTSDSNSLLDDTEYFSIAGGVSVDKVNLYVLHETVESGASSGVVSVTNDDSYTTLGVQYNLGSNSRVWIEYWGREVDSNPNAEDIVSVGLRHDF